MGGVHKRSKKHLRFSHLLSCLQAAINEIIDCRTQEKTVYTLSDFYTSGFAMFYLPANFTPCEIKIQFKARKLTGITNNTYTSALHMPQTSNFGE